MQHHELSLYTHITLRSQLSTLILHLPCQWHARRTLVMPRVQSRLFALLSFQGLSKLQDSLDKNTQNGGDAMALPI